MLYWLHLWFNVTHACTLFLCYFVISSCSVVELHFGVSWLNGVSTENIMVFHERWFGSNCLLGVEFVELVMLVGVVVCAADQLSIWKEI